MDQLKVLLEYKFWILAGVALLLPPIGWYAATDDLAADNGRPGSRKSMTPKNRPAV